VSSSRTAHESLALIRNGELTAAQVLDDCVNQIEATEGALNAWVALDREQAAVDARNHDVVLQRNNQQTALQGMPVGVKDICDTASFPGRQPGANCAVVENLINAGAIILGKTVTTEFAYLHPSLTNNPHNSAYSPGGSSSGSAAAVAAGHVPLAIGSQTGGSVIRPASFCGVFGFKPSRGMVSRRGVFQTSETLDHVGVFARSLPDIALLLDVVKGHDPADPASFVEQRDEMLVGLNHTMTPRLAYIDMPYKTRYSVALESALERAIARLATQVDRISAPPMLADLPACNKTISDYEIYRCLQGEREEHWEMMSRTAQNAMQRAATVTTEAYQQALRTQQTAQDWFASFFDDYDAIVTPSATGVPPRQGDGTGDPICCVIWTLCGLPCLTMPLLTGEDAMPMGLQLVGAHQADCNVLRSAQWVLQQGFTTSV